MRLLLKSLLIGAASLMPLSAFAQDLSQPPEVEIQTQGNFTRIVTSIPEVKEQMKLLESIRKRPAEDNQEVIDWIKQRSDHLQPAFLYELSRRLFASDKDAALEWYAVGQIRAQYDAFRCTDGTARQGIFFLPMIAKDVAIYARARRKELERAGLRALARPDLFTDKVSPIWICTHGMDTVKAGFEKKRLSRDQLFTPEKDWPQLKQELLAKNTDFYRKQAKPQTDPVPANKEQFAVYEPPDQQDLKKYAWLNGNELVLGVDNGSGAGRKTIDLLLWNPRRDEEIREIHRGTLVWCAGQGNIMYETGFEKPEEDAMEFEYQFGPIGNTSGKRLVTRPGQFQFASQLISRMFRGWNGEANIQSPLDCSWTKNDGLTEEKSDRWSRLLGNTGYLVFSYNKNAPAGHQSVVSHIKKQGDEGVELPIRWSGVDPACLKYYDFRKAYFLYPCRGGRRSLPEFKKQGCIPYWWLKERDGELDVTQECVPMDSVSENLPMTVPSQAGLLRITEGRRTYQGMKIGGVYLTDHGGKATKIFDGWVQDVLMSPGGCLLALRHRPDQSKMETKLNVIDVCSVGASASQ